jgi:hypothetical protein
VVAILLLLLLDELDDVEFVDVGDEISGVDLLF